MAFAAPLAAAAAVVGGVSAVQNGLYQSAVGKNNAAIASQNAAAAAEAAQIEQMRSDREYGAQMGEVEAVQSASGIDLLSSTQQRSRLLMGRMRGEAATDIRRAGEQNSQQLQQDAANFRAEGRQAKLQGFVTGFGKMLEAGSTFAPGGSNASLITKAKPRKPWSKK